jgi:SAM-dependent methyltransferase
MGSESSKSNIRRRREGYFERFLNGCGIDIGCGDDPVTPDCVKWDMAQGDGQELVGVEAYAFDWVYSSHCLEHLASPTRALSRWWEVLKPGGYLMVVVPDEDLYEQGCWPSRFNSGHRWTFSVSKESSWSPASLNVTELVAALPNRRVLWIRTIDDGYDYSGGIWDRTAGSAEANIEVLVQKL